MKKLLKISFILCALSPTFAYALMESGQLGNTRRFFESVQSLVNTLVPIVFTMALLVFFWGIVKFIWSSGAGKDEGKRIMLWGIIALFVMSSVWGLTTFIRESFGVREVTEVTIPTIIRP